MLDYEDSPIELIFPWCDSCSLYHYCYVGTKINFIEEDCRFGVASGSYVKMLQKELNYLFVEESYYV